MKQHTWPPPRSTARLPASQPAGFTIIELLIVLAMAGVILMLTFLALPALQRNSHNTQRRQNVTAVLTAISHYQLNNGGTIPDPSDTTWKQSLKLTEYSQGDIYIFLGSTATLPAASNVDRINIYNYHRCDDTTHGATSQAADYRDIVALYAIEKGGGGVAGLCQQL
jgi:prepilin-type N-terminal cleavage/methylation domain-containing protein